jgi:RNA polymerase sigma-70 factor (ECF subfamily)
MLEAGEILRTLDEVARGNRDAFRVIVRAYSLPLRSYLASQTHNMEDVDDIAQEVFLAVFHSLNSFRHGDDFGAWIRGIARNKLHDHLRRLARRNRVMGEFRQEVARVVEADLDRAAAADRAETIALLLRCVARLPEKLRRVVRGGLNGDKPAAQAEALATSVGAIYNLHYRANQLLRMCLEKEMG